MHNYLAHFRFHILLFAFHIPHFTYCPVIPFSSVNRHNKITSSLFSRPP